jgi:hypothetical protein
MKLAYRICIDKHKHDRTWLENKFIFTIKTNIHQQSLSFLCKKKNTYQFAVSRVLDQTPACGYVETSNLCQGATGSVYLSKLAKLENSYYIWSLFIDLRKLAHSKVATDASQRRTDPKSKFPF